MNVQLNNSIANLTDLLDPYATTKASLSHLTNVYLENKRRFSCIISVYRKKQPRNY